MIVKKVPTSKRGALKNKALNVRVLVDYIAGPRAGGENEKVEHRGAANLLNMDHEAQAQEMIDLAQVASRSAQPVQHWIISWREGEQPTAAQSDDAVATFLDEMGLPDHPVIYALHRDTQNYHLHLAVNRVNPDSEKLVTVNNGFDHEVAHRAIARIERDQGWQPEGRRLFVTRPDGDLVRARPRGHGERQPSGPARDFEERVGERSAQRIALDVAAPIIREARGWREMNEALAREGIRFERKGSGAVLWIGDQPVKASRAGRDCSMAALQKRFGEPAVDHEPPDLRGASREAQPAGRETSHWRAYARERARHHEGREARRQGFRDRQRDDWRRLTDRHRRERDEIFKGSWRGHGDLLNATRSQLAARQARDKADLRDQQKLERARRQREQTRFPAFKEWLAAASVIFGMPRMRPRSQTSGGTLRTLASMKNPTVNLPRRHSRQFLTLAGTVSLGLGVAVGCAPAEDHTIATTSRLAANTPPSADAGPDQTIIWPAAAMLNGAVSDDWLPDPPGTLAALWTVVSGPGDVAFRFDYDPKARARFSAPGVYVLRLTASDTELSTSDDVVITVEAVSYNQAPFIDVGTDPPVIFPRAFEAFLGVETWDDGLPVVPGSLSVLWEQVSGPSTATIRAPTAFTTSFTVPTSGEYRFRVTVSDGELSTTAEYLLVGDDPPRTDAGPDQTITLPATVALHGTVTDDGFPREFGISHIWFMLEGPAPVSFGDEWALDTTATFSTPGRYVIMLSGSDGAIGDEDTLEVTVLPASGGLTVSAGPDRTTILPAVAVVAARVDYPGRPPRHSQEAVSWQQVSGPGTASFANPDGRLSVVRFSAPGQYVLRVTVTNGPLSGVDDIVINVRPYSY